MYHHTSLKKCNPFSCSEKKLQKLQLSIHDTVIQYCTVFCEWMTVSLKTKCVWEIIKYICTVDRLETAPEEKTYNKQEHKAGGKERMRDAGVNIHTICLPDEQMWRNERLTYLWSWQESSKETSKYFKGFFLMPRCD